MANRILVYDGGKNIGIAGTAEGQLPTWDAASSSWQVELPPVFAGEYFVSTNGSNTTGNGSLSQPFATIQKAVDAAKLAYADGVPVAINVAAGSYADALTIDRYNTYIRGAGARPEENRATQITVAVTINCTSASDVFGRQVGIDGCYINSNADAPAVSVTGTGYFSVIVTDSYLTTGNAGSSANAFACDNANARTVVTDSICTVQNSAATAVVLNFTAGTHLWSNTRVQHGSSVTATATSKMLLVGGTASMFADRLLMEPRTNGYQIDVTGTWTSTTTAKLILSNSSLANAAAGGLGLTTDISPAAGALAVLLYDNAFTVASGNVVYSAVASIVLYCDLTFFGASSTLSGITGVPLTNRTGALQVDSLTLPNGTASRFLYTNSSKVATALGSGTKALAGYNESGAPDVITLGSGLSMTGSVLSATGGGGGGSGTVTEVATGTGLTGGPITTTGTISLAALDPAPTGSYGSATAVPAITVDTYGRLTAASEQNIAIDASQVTAGTLSVARGGTGLATIPQHEVLIGNGTGAITSVALGDGELLIGDTGGSPAAATLSAGTGVSILNAAHSITLSIGQAVSTADSPTFTGLTLSGATASRFAYFNTSKALTALGDGASKLVGYDDASAVSVITLGTGLAMSGSTLNATATGTVTSVAASSPLTITGTATVTPTVAFASQSPNTVLAGPSTGGSAAPTFRALTTTDLPALPYDVSGEAAGTPDVSTVIFHFRAARAWTLKGTGSVAGCEVSPTGANVSYTIKKGASSIGTLDFTTGGTNSVTITGGSDVSFAIGEVLTVTTPSDLKTMEAPFFTFLGTCP